MRGWEEEVVVVPQNLAELLGLSLELSAVLLPPHHDGVETCRQLVQPLCLQVGAKLTDLFPAEREREREREEVMS